MVLILDPLLIVALALKKCVLFDVQDDIQIAGWAAECSGLPESSEADASAIFDSGGHFGLDLALAQQTAFAFALRARIGDDAARALASWAGSSNAEEALLIPDLASPIA